ncbi:MAG TPA: N,N-dimethylformamidase beta subunit family domain-containing protein [Chloroflexia bacterium]|nr:N,N-dimethylformamidase beta subunit family domain-containing protein [Chloroflexia bacterium]
MLSRRKFLQATAGVAGYAVLGGCDAPVPPTAGPAPPAPPAAATRTPARGPAPPARPALTQDPTPPPGSPAPAVTIRGYPARASVHPGATLVLHIATAAPHFHIEIYRQTTTLELMTQVFGLAGQWAAERAASDDFQWPAYPLAIPGDWPSGAYLARCVVDTPADIPPATGEILFVVRSAQPGRTATILYKLPLATYHAYNCTGTSANPQDPDRASLYVNPLPSTHPVGSKVTLHRPGGGAGGTICEPPDFYDGTSPRQTFAHWDAPMIQWLAQHGYAVDYCTDLDLHEEPALLAPYRLLLSVGHDEYWSAAMRAQVEVFIEHGGNVAFFSGNICWWRIQFVDGNTAIICDKTDGADNWYRIRPENALTGVSYRNGGGAWAGARPPLGYTVQHPEHWVYAGTGLRAGQVFGATAHPPLIGYECDGAHHTRTAQGLALADGSDGTPAGFVILGTAYLDPHAVPAWDERRGQSTATMGVYTRGGTVFTAATTDWAKVLAADPIVATITHTVIRTLNRRGGPAAG